MGTLVHEIRSAVRKLLRDPFLAGVSVIALALGIGLTASMFSIAYSVLFKGMPFDDPDELMAVTRTFSESGRSTNTTSFLDFLDWQDQQSAFTAFGAWQGSSKELVDGEGQPERILVTYLSPSMLPLLREAPAMGRGFGSDETGPDARVALVSHDLWQTRYGADPGFLGRSLRLNGESFTVIGIMPEGFSFPDQQDLWLPLPYDPTMAGRDQAFVRVLGRLPPDTDPNLARTELDAIAARLAMEYPETNAPVRIGLVPLVHTFMSEEDTRLLWTLVLASFFVLLIACANVANLLAARGLDRSGDVAVATALGASRRRVVGQLFLESLLLALAGAVFGVGLALYCVDWFDKALGPRKPVWMTFQVDGPVLTFILGAALIAALAAGLTPAIRAASISVREILQDESRGASSRQLGRLSRGMVVLTIALAYPLLVAAGLLIASFQETSRELVEEGDRVLTIQFSLPAWRYSDSVQWRAFWDEMVDWAQGQPGVVSASWGESAPPGNTGLWRMEEEGVQYLREDDRPLIRMARVRPGFFSVLGVTPLRGRAFDAQDRTGPPVAIVNEAFVARFLSGQDPLGHRVRLADVEGDPWHAVVGVVPDLRMNGTDESAPEGIYLPSPPMDLAYGYLILRGAGETAPLVRAVRERVGAMDPELPVVRSETLQERVDRSFWFVTVIGSIFSVFGLAALFLSSVGLFGVMAHSVSMRDREIRLRMALGATGGSVFWLILRNGLAQVAVGLAVGSILALLGTRLLAGVLFGVGAGDVGTMAAVGAVLVAAAVVAIIQPAIRATRYSSAHALQAE